MPLCFAKSRQTVQNAVGRRSSLLVTRGWHRLVWPVCSAAWLLSGCASPAGGTSATGQVLEGAAPERLSAEARLPREQTADQQVQHVLHRLAFGPRPGDVEAVRRFGVDAWIEQQLHPERLPDSVTTALMGRYQTVSMTAEQLLAEYPPANVALAALARRGNGVVSAEDSARLRQQARRSTQFLGELASSRVARAVVSERQLEEVLVDFWENHFNVFAGKDRTRYFLTDYDRTIRQHALGNFRALLGAVAKSPAMLYYLDNWQSVADSGRPTLQPVRANARAGSRAAQRRADVARQRVMDRMAQNPALQQLAQRRRGLNENYARELMELHTLGVDGGYTQQDVIAVAQALTGWTLERGAQGGGFVFRGQVHDAGAKTILGKSFPAGRGVEEGEAVLDLLASRPQTATFIASKLARRLVSDTPPPALVARAAATFRRTDGDIRETVRTIVTSPEFFSTAAYRAKVKSPFELVASTLRALQAPADGTPRTAQVVSRLGQPIFGHQAPNGYPEVGSAWMNTGAILNRINFGLTVASGRMAGVRLAQWPSYRTLASLNREAQVEGVIRDLLGGAVSSDTRQVLMTGTNPFLAARGAGTDTLLTDPDDDEPRMTPAARRATVAPTGLALIVGLALGAPEFQRR
ncbi:DUF1800 domain-containing protein [Gemmatimonas phototrophica]|uniref:DUF1800 domain-containing protein n=1 Tax=Gemmatimonas phototrophica TaxID=1379270 RepID=UPI0006A6D28B|nr:DUF1800 domain-containing protein [Gemmatimonas phototrophica]